MMEYNKFLESVQHARNYPSNVLRNDNHAPTIDAYCSRFRERKKALFGDERLKKLEDRELALRSQKRELNNEETYKKSREGKRAWLTIRDYGFVKPGHVPNDTNDLITAATASPNIQFRQMCLDSYTKMLSQLDWECLTGNDSEQKKRVHQDPKCRLIIIPARNSDKDLLRITEDMMLLILTYHQISPCYLNFVTCLRSATSASDLRFGGFRSMRSLTNPGSQIPELGRSGMHYELAFCLQTIQQHKVHSDSKREYKEKQQAAAIYHKFDIREGRALWVVNCQEELRVNDKPINYLWKKIRDTINREECGSKLAANEIHRAFSATLDVIEALAAWSLGMCPFYLTTLEERLFAVTERNLDSNFDDEDPAQAEQIEEDLREIASVIDALQDCNIRLKNNKRVIESLDRFYGTELIDDMKRAPEDLKLNWTGKAEGYVKDLALKLRRIVIEIDSIADRWDNLNELAKNKDRLIQQLLQNGQNTKMAKITTLTRDDSKAMRNFALITLYLLPVTVISTILGTDIVKFQSGGNGPATSPYTFSPAAFVTWLILAILLTGACLAFSKVFPVPGWWRKTWWKTLFAAIWGQQQQSCPGKQIPRNPGPVGGGVNGVEGSRSGDGSSHHTGREGGEGGEVSGRKLDNKRPANLTMTTALPMPREEGPSLPPQTPAGSSSTAVPSNLQTPRGSKFSPDSTKASTRNWSITGISQWSLRPSLDRITGYLRALPHRRFWRGGGGDTVLPQ